MTSITLTLYVPNGVSSNEVSQYLSSSNNNISPPFQNKYQDLINSRYGNRRDYRIEKFQVAFPRGPVQCYRHEASRRSSSSSVSIINRINETFHRGLSMPLGSTVSSNNNVSRFNDIMPSSSSTIRFQCAICLEDCVEGQRQQILPCMHKFHSSCIGNWLSNSNKCPTCRYPILPDLDTISSTRPNVNTNDPNMMNLINNIRNI
jgi:hypothetical protein